MTNIQSELQKTLGALEPQMRGKPPSTVASGSRQALQANVNAIQSFISGGFVTYGERKLQTMLSETLRFATAMSSSDQPAYWLSLLGASGTGKTMLAKKLAQFFRFHLEGLPDEHRSGPGRRYFRHGGLLSWPKCIEHMLKRDYGFMRQACEDWFLALDDIGTEHHNLRYFSAGKLFTILNAREGKFTVLTANLSLEEVADKLDPRIASRLLRHGGTVIDSSGVLDHSLRSL